MKHHSINLDSHHSIDIDDLSTILRHAGYEVDWPVTGKLLLDGTELDVDDILMQATDAYEAAEWIIDFKLDA